MPIACWAPDCNHNNIANDCSFFRFPINEKILKKWFNAIRRNDKPGPSNRLCSCHFPEGRKENAPKYFKYNHDKLFAKTFPTDLKRRRRPQKTAATATSIQDHILKENSQENVRLLEERAEEPLIFFAADSIQSDVKKKQLSIETYEAEVYLLKAENERLQMLLKTVETKFSYEEISNNEALILLYTGLPTKVLFEALYFLIEDIDIHYYLEWSVVKLNRKDQLLITLMKLRQNFPHEDLAYRFKICKATVTNIVVTFISVLHTILFEQLMNEIPSRLKNLSCSPNCASNYTNCRVILDATEAFCSIPRQSMKNQRITYSSYKHRNTFKGLVGVAPNGVITFVSKLYGGSTSDKEIVKNCGILSALVSGDLVLADKGFLIQDILPAGVNLNIPPFLCTNQFTPEQVRLTESIARARIHVERAIRRMKSFKILSFIPEPLFGYSSSIFQVVGALTNLQYPLIKEVTEFFTE